MHKSWGNTPVGYKKVRAIRQLMIKLPILIDDCYTFCYNCLINYKTAHHFLNSYA